MQFNLGKNVKTKRLEGIFFVTDQWNLLIAVNRINADCLEASAEVPENSIWVQGHFPGEPIVPGIALINAVHEVIASDARNRGESVVISSLKRIRFTGPVRPGDKLSLSLTHDGGQGETSFQFKVAVGENVVCSGLMAVTKI